MPCSRTAFSALTLLALAVLSLPSPGNSQVPKPAGKRGPGNAPYPAGPPRLRLVRHARVSLLASSPTGTVAESEPNNSVSQADLATLTDTATGAIDPSGD